MLTTAGNASEIPVSEAPRSPSAPRKLAPPGSADCHFHVFGPKDIYPLSPGRGYTPADEANPQTYMDVSNTLGIERFVIVQPTAYGTDHTYALAAAEAYGLHRTRVVAVVDETFTFAQLQEFDRRGVCATRINSVTKNGVPIRQLETIANLISPLGWHLQLYVEGGMLPQLADKLLSLPVDIVIDHMGRIPTAAGLEVREFQALLRMMDSEKCWVKLCGYRCSSLGPPYDDLLPQARALIERAPDRCVWGSDWPHLGLYGDMAPDAGKLLDLLYDWSPDPEQLHRTLVTNPEKLYGFKS